jgi:hypothetical protein
MAGSAKVAAAPKQTAETEQHQRPGARRHKKADIFCKGHQALFDAFHEEHQAKHYGTDAEGDGSCLVGRGAQGQCLETDQHKCQGNDGTDLFKKANRNVGCQQAMNIECTETTLASRHGALHGDHLVVADLSMMAADGAEILAVAYAFLCHFLSGP